ncbi:acetyltransferase (GNAT) family domain-containing protein [Hirsutella rhossiliensis]|uniref:Acetyltransferase (GNAT) family domain-containing protein n=1 Tax=Hirsutella rhossiliensis TaxID=111463 RepID=A0A9P8SD60_9HYPO|nr:acetyltransferase (GNAT) family domain-containing protein [Hirsutella rhossiliensis]KAH0957604.1 acetyltransferase (GNAT) family domain-containing protein [Hirsutella rhossiliensis]
MSPASRAVAGGPQSNPVCIRQAVGPADIAAVRECFQAYTEWLNEDISFQNYAAELDGLPGKYAPPSGALLLAVNPSDDRALGCIAMRPIQLKPEYLCNRKANVKVCEMKRLFVYPEARGRQVASALVQQAMALARRAGHDEMVLDTMIRMQPAIKLYESQWFAVSEPYYFNPLPGVVYFTRNLRHESPTGT